MIRLKRYVLPLLLLAFLSACQKGNHIKPFTTDGCSHFPNGTLAEKELWLQCCIKHDWSYWQGGTYSQRLAADKELRECVARAGEPEIANLMLGGVRVGGTPFLPSRFRWGYGWDYPRGYKALSSEEKERVGRKIVPAME